MHDYSQSLLLVEGVIVGAALAAGVAYLVSKYSSTDDWNDSPQPKSRDREGRRKSRKHHSASRSVPRRYSLRMTKRESMQCRSSSPTRKTAHRAAFSSPSGSGLVSFGRYNDPVATQNFTADHQSEHRIHVSVTKTCEGMKLKDLDEALV